MTRFAIGVMKDAQSYWYVAVVDRIEFAVIWATYPSDGPVCPEDVRTATRRAEYYLDAFYPNWRTDLLTEAREVTR
jgi:hypothetical protein